MSTEKIKFGTDGWRAIIAREFTVENVRRVAQATGLWVQEQAKELKRPAHVVVGFDCRFGGLMFARATAEVLAAQGIKVTLDPKFCATPMLSLATAELQATAGVIITASHNPPEYNGFKIKAHYGGPATPDMIQWVEDRIPSSAPAPGPDYASLKKAGNIQEMDLTERYLKKVEGRFDLEKIRQLRLAYDAMYGAGQRAIREILPQAEYLHCDENPGFEGQAPEPIHKNLQALSQMLEIAAAEGESLDAGFANDGDADRIGMYDSRGRFVDSHHLLLLLIQYLVTQKGMKGPVITTFSTCSKIAVLCKHHGLEHTVVKIGFKYICDLMLASKEPVLVGGEESGGIAIAGHVPERDGIWIALTLLEYMAVTGKNLEQLIDEVYAITGSFSVERNDLHLSQELKEKAMEACKKGKFKEIGGRNIVRTQDLDGYKFHLQGGEWLMVRPSGTEPVLRTYAEAPDSQAAYAILSDAEKLIRAL